MRQTPSKCPKCNEPNIHNLDYCAVCGSKFRAQRSPVQKPPAKNGGLSREKKLKAKRIKKRKELTELFKNRKITVEQYSAGLRKLGYSTNADKAAAFKKYIKEQIKAFEDMKLDENAPSEGSYYDPNEAQTDLPRDQYGNVIVDFMTTPSSEGKKRPTEDMVVVDHGGMESGAHGPRFGSSLFGDRGPGEKRVRTERREQPKMFQKTETRRRAPRRIRALADWDDDEEQEGEEEEEDEFEIEVEGESGWWDDEEWTLEWTDEDEEEFDDLEIDEDEEQEWVLEFEDEEEEGEEEEEDVGYTIEFDDEEDGSEEVAVEIEFEDEEEEDDDDDWGRVRRRRRRNR